MGIVNNLQGRSISVYKFLEGNVSNHFSFNSTFYYFDIIIINYYPDQQIFGLQILDLIETKNTVKCLFFTRTYVLENLDVEKFYSNGILPKREYNSCKSYLHQKNSLYQNRGFESLPTLTYFIFNSQLELDEICITRTFILNDPFR